MKTEDTPIRREAKQASCYKWRAWQRRAETIHRNIEALQGDMIEALGVEHGATDLTDNVLAEAEDLCHGLSRLAEASKRKKS